MSTLRHQSWANKGFTVPSLTTSSLTTFCHYDFTEGYSAARTTISADDQNIIRDLSSYSHILLVSDGFVNNSASIQYNPHLAFGAYDLRNTNNNEGCRMTLANYDGDSNGYAINTLIYQIGFKINAYTPSVLRKTIVGGTELSPGTRNWKFGYRDAGSSYVWCMDATGDEEDLVVADSSKQPVVNQWVIVTQRIIVGGGVSVDTYFNNYKCPSSTTLSGTWSGLEFLFYIAHVSWETYKMGDISIGHFLVCTGNWFTDADVFATFNAYKYKYGITPY